MPPQILINIILIVVGLTLGSLATAMAHRVPLKKTFGIDRSACPQCGHVLKWFDLFPLFSWLSTAGRCRYCRKDIGLAYPLMELGVLAACMIVYWVKGLTTDTFFIIAAVPFLAALFVIDLRHMILPNILMICVGAIGLARLAFYAVYQNEIPDLGLVFQFLTDVLIFAGVSWLLAFVVEKVLKKEALGFGDVKFFALAGLWLGLSKLNFYLILSGVFGVLLGSIFRNNGKGGAFPFGPALILAFYLLLLTNSSLLG